MALARGHVTGWKCAASDATCDHAAAAIGGWVRDLGEGELTDRNSPAIENFGRSEADRQIEAEDRRHRMGADMHMAMDGRVPPSLARLWWS